MVKETAGQEEFLLTTSTAIHFEYYCKIEKRQLWDRGFRRNSYLQAVRYFDRAYYGLYVTSSRMSVLVEGNKI